MALVTVQVRPSGDPPNFHRPPSSGFLGAPRRSPGLFSGYSNLNPIEHGISQARAAQDRADGIPACSDGTRVVVSNDMFGSCTRRTVLRTGYGMCGDKFRMPLDGRLDDLWIERWACR